MGTQNQEASNPMKPKSGPDQVLTLQLLDNEVFYTRWHSSTISLHPTTQWLLKAGSHWVVGWWEMVKEYQRVWKYFNVFTGIRPTKSKCCPLYLCNCFFGVAETGQGNEGLQHQAVLEKNDKIAP